MPPSPSTSVQSRKGCRFAAFAAAVAAAAVWNLALFGAFQWLLGGAERWAPADWFLVLVFMPFAAAGFALVGLAVYLGVPLGNPRVRLEVFPSRSGPGDALEIAWDIQGSLDRIQVLTIQLEGREEATRSGRSGLSTRTEVFRRHPIFRTADPDRIRSGGTAFTVPDDALPSFSGRRNRIAWYVCLYSGVGRWPHVRQELEYPIVPTRRS